jgi:hypothetical protein
MSAQKCHHQRVYQQQRFVGPTYNSSTSTIKVKSLEMLKTPNYPLPITCPHSFNNTTTS